MFDSMAEAFKRKLSQMKHGKLDPRHSLPIHEASEKETGDETQESNADKFDQTVDRAPSLQKDGEDKEDFTGPAGQVHKATEALMDSHAYGHLAGDSLGNKAKEKMASIMKHKKDGGKY